MLAWLFHPPDVDSEILNPHTLAVRAEHDAIDAVERAKEVLVKAESRLATATNDFGDEDDWNQIRIVSKAEEAYEAALCTLEVAEAKLDWERRGAWKRSLDYIPTEAVTARTKALLTLIDWSRLRPKL